MQRKVVDKLEGLACLSNGLAVNYTSSPDPTEAAPNTQFWNRLGSSFGPRSELACFLEPVRLPKLRSSAAPRQLADTENSEVKTEREALKHTIDFSMAEDMEALRRAHEPKTERRQDRQDLAEAYTWGSND